MCEMVPCEVRQKIIQRVQSKGLQTQIKVKMADSNHSLSNVVVIQRASGGPKQKVMVFGRREDAPYNTNPC